MPAKKTNSSTDRATAYAEAGSLGSRRRRAACAQRLPAPPRRSEARARSAACTSTKAAARAIRFFETKLKLSEGQFEGKPLILHESQAFKVGSIFGWKRRTAPAASAAPISRRARATASRRSPAASASTA
jgi:hypothetical protein